LTSRFRGNAHATSTSPKRQVYAGPAADFGYLDLVEEVRKTSVKADFTYTGVNNFTNLTGFSLHKTAAAESTKCSCQKEVKGNNSCSSGTR
jgi:hypothetical protein